MHALKIDEADWPDFVQRFSISLVLTNSMRDLKCKSIRAVILDFFTCVSNTLLMVML